jgi:hypothetical protein
MIGADEIFNVQPIFKQKLEKIVYDLLSNDTSMKSSVERIGHQSTQKNLSLDSQFSLRTSDISSNSNKNHSHSKGSRSVNSKVRNSLVLKSSLSHKEVLYGKPIISLLKMKPFKLDLDRSSTDDLHSFSSFVLHGSNTPCVNQRSIPCSK